MNEEAEKLLSYAKAISDYCKENVNCKDCPFIWENSIHPCMFDNDGYNQPYNWF